MQHVVGDGHEVVVELEPPNSEPTTGSPSRICNRGAARLVRSREISPPVGVPDDAGHGSVDGKEGGAEDGGGTLTTGGRGVGMGAVRIGALTGAAGIPPDVAMGGIAIDGVEGADAAGAAGLLIVAVGEVVVVMPKPVP